MKKKCHAEFRLRNVWPPAGALQRLKRTWSQGPARSSPLTPAPCGRFRFETYKSPSVFQSVHAAWSPESAGDCPLALGSMRHFKLWNAQEPSAGVQSPPLAAGSMRVLPLWNPKEPQQRFLYISEVECHRCSPSLPRSWREPAFKLAPPASAPPSPRLFLMR